MTVEPSSPAKPLSLLLRTTWSITQVALWTGLALAAVQVFGRRHVLEFQAGSASTLTERLRAIAQQTAVEAVGFGLVGLGCALVGLVVGRLAARSESPAARFGAGVAASASAFGVWTAVASLAEDALPFLSFAQTLLLNATALATCLACVLAYVFLAGLVPGAGRARPAQRAVVAAALALVAVHLGLELLFGSARRLDTPLRLAASATPFLVGLLLAAPLARVLARPLAALGTRLAAGRPLPRGFGLAALAVLVACVGWTAANLQLSSVQSIRPYYTLQAPGDPPGPNVLYITIDTLRADHLGSYGYERPTSPFLDSIAAGGARCADPVAPAAWTKPTTGTILTGLHPSRHGALYHGSVLRLPEGERTLAEAFREAGYVTAGFVTNPNIKRVFGFDRGFDEFFDSPVEDTVTLAAIRGALIGRIATDLLRHQFNWKYENDVRTMNQHVFRWLEQHREQPFFLYVHYIDPHSPYSPPEPYRSEFLQDHEGLLLFNERKERVGRDLYDGEIRYTDEGLRELYAELERLGIAENTLLVVTSDHGEEWFEHGVLGHGYSLFQPVVGVPLLFHGPGVPAGTVVDGPVQMVDTAATVLDLAGTGIDRLGDGRSFAARIRDEAPTDDEQFIFLENEFAMSHVAQRDFVFKGVRKGRWKLVITEANAYFPLSDPANEAFALYDLQTDPGETRNLFHEPSSRPVIEELMQRLDAHLAHLEATGFRDQAPVQMSEEIQRNLEALGY